MWLALLYAIGHATVVFLLGLAAISFTAILPEWVVGTLSVAYDDTEDRIVLQAEELVDEEEAEDPGHARFHLTRAQVVAYCERAAELVASGRPPCPICGQPMDPDGHVCPRSNGHRKPPQ